jgi:hypothetical protein
VPIIVPQELELKFLWDFYPLPMFKSGAVLPLCSDAIANWVTVLEVFKSAENR